VATKSHKKKLFLSILIGRLFPKPISIK